MAVTTAIFFPKLSFSQTKVVKHISDFFENSLTVEISTSLHGKNLTAEILYQLNEAKGADTFIVLNSEKDTLSIIAPPPNVDWPSGPWLTFEDIPMQLFFEDQKAFQATLELGVLVREAPNNSLELQAGALKRRLNDSNEFLKYSYQMCELLEDKSKFSSSETLEGFPNALGVSLLENAAKLLSHDRSNSSMLRDAAILLSEKTEMPLEKRAILKINKVLSNSTHVEDIFIEDIERLSNYKNCMKSIGQSLLCAQIDFIIAQKMQILDLSASLAILKDAEDLVKSSYPGMASKICAQKAATLIRMGNNNDALRALEDCVQYLNERESTAKDEWKKVVVQVERLMLQMSISEIQTNSVKLSTDMSDQAEYLVVKADALGLTALGKRLNDLKNRYQKHKDV
jgi:hypothetical protein